MHEAGAADAGLGTLRTGLPLGHVGSLHRIVGLPPSDRYGDPVGVALLSAGIEIFPIAAKARKKTAGPMPAVCSDEERNFRSGRAALLGFGLHELGLKLRQLRLERLYAPLGCFGISGRIFLGCLDLFFDVGDLFFKLRNGRGGRSGS